VFSQRIKKNYLKLIQKSQTCITMETPYFIPGYRLYRELLNALRRGVKVRIIIPYRSDMKMVDLMRREILKPLHRAGASIWLYRQGNLHAKLLTVDNRLASISSANLDHRSFKYMFEIALLGSDSDLLRLVEEHIENTCRMCVPLDVDFLKNVPLHKRFFAWLLKPFRHLL
jgi:cardiolipin synthase